jgi:iron complex outermembrane receptor protein
MKRLSSLIVLFFITNIFNPLLAQTNGHTVKGVVAGNEKKIDAATIYVLRSKDSSILKTSVSDKDGSFAVANITDGSYLLSVEAIGYKKFYTKAFKLTSSDNATLDLHTLSLAAADAAMNTVVVTSKRPFIEQKIDKTVVNVDASPTNTGLNAL